jgi:uncharacterized RDD family membrane protein YckC
LAPSLRLNIMVERDLSERVPEHEVNGHWEPPPLMRRFGALVLDWIACLLVSGTFAKPMSQGWAPVLVLIAVYGFFVGLFAQTPGMFLTRMRCVSVTDGAPIGIPRALLRGVLLALFVPALILDSDKRGLHDRLAGSVVLTNRPPAAEGSS